MNLTKPLSRMKAEEQDDLVAEVREDWLAAVDARKGPEERALRNNQLYMRAARDAEAQRVDRQGFSKLEVPAVFEAVEQIMPRLGVQPPSITVNARSAEAVAFAQAKQMRLQHQINVSRWDLPYQLMQKSKLIIGDGILKVGWDAECENPRLTYVDWFDFFVSAEATVFEMADVQFHRSFYTRRQLMALRGQKDRNDKPLWHNLDLEDLPPGGTREQLDDTWARRNGFTSDQMEGRQGGNLASALIPVIEAWYRSGEYVVLAGQDFRTVIRAQMSPFRRRRKDGEFHHLRPFCFFRNTILLKGPYSMGEAEALEHHQVEMSTLTNMQIDQLAGSINAPIVHDEDIRTELVEQAFSRPKGVLPVPWGPNGPNIMRMPPGQTTPGFAEYYAMRRDEIQRISGLNDNSAGQAADGQQTATEVSALINEANWRIRLKRRMDEIAMGDVARAFDDRDRQFGGVVEVAVEPGFSPNDGSKGFLGDQSSGELPALARSLMAGRPSDVTPQMARGLAKIGPEVNQPGAEYDIEIDAGSAQRPDQMEEAQKFNALVGTLSHPMIMPNIDWLEITRQAITVNGRSPEKLMKPPAPPMPAGMPPVGPDGAPLAPPAPPVAPPGPPEMNGAPPMAVAA